MQVHVRCAGKGWVHVSERRCRSRCLERARERAGRGLESGQRAAWAAAIHWASTMVARGPWWRGSRGWLASCTLVGTSMRWVASGFGREGEGLGSSRHWPVGFQGSPGQWGDADWGVQGGEGKRVREGDLGQDLPRELPSLVSICMGQRA
jgi:hypothetical protein